MILSAYIKVHHEILWKCHILAFERELNPQLASADEVDVAELPPDSAEEDVMQPSRYSLRRLTRYAKGTSYLTLMVTWFTLKSPDLPWSHLITLLSPSPSLRYIRKKRVAHQSRRVAVELGDESEEEGDLEKEKMDKARKRIGTVYIWVLSSS